MPGISGTASTSSAKTDKGGKSGDTGSAIGTDRVSGAGPSAPARTEAGKDTTDKKDAGKSGSDARKAAAGASDGNGQKGSSDGQPQVIVQRRGGGVLGFLSHMAAGIIGAAAVVFGAQYAPPGLIPPDLGIGIVDGRTNANNDADARAALEEQINALTSQVATLQSSAADTSTTAALPEDAAAEIARIGDLARQIEDLKAAQDTAASQTAQVATQVEQALGGEAAPDQLAARLGKLESDIAGLANINADGSEGVVQQFLELKGQINDFDAELDSKLSGLRTSVEQQLANTTSTIDSKLEALSAKTDAQLERLATVDAASRRLGSELEVIKTQGSTRNQSIATLEDETRGVSRKVSESVERIDAVAKSVDETRATLTAQLEDYAPKSALASAVDGVNATVAQLSDKIDGVAAREATRAEGTRQIVLALELSELKRIIARGDAFNTELQRVKSIAPQALDFAALEPFAEKGVPTPTALSEAFPDAARRALDAELEEQGASLFDQFVAGASTIVRVRRTGDVEGTSTEAIVARMETDLEEGELVAAAREAEALSDKAASAMSNWLTQLKARVAVDRAVARVEDSLKSSLAGGAVDGGAAEADGGDGAAEGQAG